MFSFGATGTTKEEVETLIAQADTRGELSERHKDALGAALATLGEGTLYTTHIHGTDDQFSVAVTRVPTPQQPAEEPPPIAA